MPILEAPDNYATTPNKEGTKITTTNKSAKVISPIGQDSALVASMQILRTLDS